MVHRGTPDFSLSERTALGMPPDSHFSPAEYLIHHLSLEYRQKTNISCCEYTAVGSI